MRALAWTALALAVAACQAAAAVTRDETTVAGVTLFIVGEHEDLVGAGLEIEAALDDGKRVALTGSSARLGVLKPDDVYAWPTTNTVVLDPAAGMGIFGFNATDAVQRAALLKAWVWAERADVTEEPPRPIRGAEPRRRLLDVNFDLSAASPSSVCRAFRRKMYSTVFGERIPAASEFRVFAREMRRWCQYGNLSVHAAAAPQFTIAPYRSTDEPRLSLVTEWALLRNSDPIDASGTTFVFWAKTLGEGGGSGLGRRDGTHGHLSAEGGLRRLLDASIHSGWGPIEYDGVGSAWPIDSSFPGMEKTGLFVCDGPDGDELFGCPRRPRLKTLYPADSIDGVVTVSRAERFIVGGSAQAGVSIDTTGKVTPSMSFSLNLVQATTDTAQSIMRLAQTRSNTDARFYRTTRWTPDVPAIYRWINARDHVGSLVEATPLAGTLNPQYEIVWEVPLRGNEGRRLSYTMVYEAGWNTCFNGPNCAKHVQPPDRTLPAKARVGWKDQIKLTIPYS
jgi:hypothetical protein